MSDDQKNNLKIKSAKKMRDLMTTYYLEALTARQNNKKIAWITSGGPVEPLLAMDIIPVYPENHAAMIGASKMGEDLCVKAENMGYSSDLCSYARADISCAVVKGGPLGGLPEPDMLICCNNICGTVLKWYEVQARYYNVPLFILDTPVCHTGYSPAIAKYVETQLGEYIAFLEKICKAPFDYDKMQQVGDLSYDAQMLWQKILETAAHKPSPMSAFDAFFFLALIVTLRGTRIAVDFYQELLEEMTQRINQGIGVVPDEQHRLLWDNLPIWPKLKWLSDKFSSHNACLVADTYTSAWCGTIKYVDKSQFLKSIAEAYTRIYLNIGVDQMADQVMDMIDFYDAKGLIMHSNRSCKPYSFGQMDIMNIVSKKKGIPVLMIEADMVDPRSFSTSQIETRIDAFMEMIKQRS
ncbi:MAG: 2-hydroxyacyl-CoA dehydratase [Proteobacteria bacterium]|nr:2-hydroxyacyl-CoA dehydratase [Pseudomonadota bacterium]MBU1388563.1 2-hydroxyacyl-CoA dehydratase [Pseudomonadota bacterium]MBU1541387.1 2-hydroxyacyl-CoA dehydratase [Pseudomonadota bacterium]MBU2480930.1 2-hydroxyacyl-CoA dehydratase [Pseudomonadota bacterium]